MTNPIEKKNTVTQFMRMMINKEKVNNGNNNNNNIYNSGIYTVSICICIYIDNTDTQTAHTYDVYTHKMPCAFSSIISMSPKSSAS